VGPTDFIAAQILVGILGKVINILYDSVINVIIPVCWIIALLTTLGCCCLQIKLVGVLDLEPAHIFLGLRDIFTKVGTALPTALHHALASTLDSIQDDVAIETYKLLELRTIECMSITQIVVGLNCIHISPVHHARVIRLSTIFRD
jgi:hypothetical protein